MRGTLFDSQSAASREVEVRLLPGDRLQLLEGRDTQSWPLVEVRVADRVPGCPAVVELPDGRRLEVTDAAAFYSSLSAMQGHARSWVHALEQRWSLVFLSVLLTLGLIYWFVTDGLPLVADVAAQAMPSEVHEAIGGEGLRVLDRFLFTPSELPAIRQGELRALFDDVVEQAGQGCDCRLEFRNAEDLGPNAFALPSGIVVLTDQLVDLAAAEDEIAAVLAHEVGHVVHRHAMRRLIQNSVATGLIVALTGDVGSATNFAAGLPAVLLNASYSRDFEREADEAAFVYMEARGIRPEALGELLLRMDEEYGRDSGSATLLDSHPASRERLEAARRRR